MLHHPRLFHSNLVKYSLSISIFFYFNISAFTRRIKLYVCVCVCVGTFNCEHCGRTCTSKIGMFAHRRSCNPSSTTVCQPRAATSSESLLQLRPKLFSPAVTVAGHVHPGSECSLISECATVEIRRKRRLSPWVCVCVCVWKRLRWRSGCGRGPGWVSTVVYHPTQNRTFRWLSSQSIMWLILT